MEEWGFGGGKAEVSTKHWSLPLLQQNCLVTSFPHTNEQCLKSEAKWVSRHPPPGTTYGLWTMPCSVPMAAWQTSFSSSIEASSDEHRRRVDTEGGASGGEAGRS